jgi:hypothetical protein
VCPCLLLLLLLLLLLVLLLVRWAPPTLQMHPLLLQGCVARLWRLLPMELLLA